jgi:hypothetical protein
MVLAWRLAMGYEDRYEVVDHSEEMRGLVLPGEPPKIDARMWAVLDWAAGCPWGDELPTSENGHNELWRAYQAWMIKVEGSPDQAFYALTAAGRAAWKAGRDGGR